jgi:hypothetical protein
MIDLAAEFVRALQSEAGREALAEAVRVVVRDEVRVGLERRDSDRIMDTGELASYLGISPAALRKRISRGSELASLRFELDGRAVWKKCDIDAAVARKRANHVSDCDGE